MPVPLISSITNLPSTLIDSVNTTYKGRTLAELTVVIGTIFSAALAILNHHHLNTGHRNYCLAVTIAGIVLYLSLASARKLGDVNQRLEGTLQNFSAENDRYAEENAQHARENAEQAAHNKKLSRKIGDLKAEVGDFKDIKRNFKGDIDAAIKDYRDANSKNKQTAEDLHKTKEALNRTKEELQRIASMQRQDYIDLLQLKVAEGTATEAHRKKLAELLQSKLNDSILTGSQSDSTFVHVPTSAS